MYKEDDVDRELPYIYKFRYNNIYNNIDQIHQHYNIYNKLNENQILIKYDLFINMYNINKMN